MKLHWFTTSLRKSHFVVEGQGCSYLIYYTTMDYTLCSSIGWPPPTYYATRGEYYRPLRSELHGYPFTITAGI